MRFPNNPETNVIMVGYSGHSYVSADILLLMGYTIVGYCDFEEKQVDPFKIPYLGHEKEYLAQENSCRNVFIGIGDNALRKKIFHELSQFNCNFINAIHPSAVIASTVQLGRGVLISANVTINPLSIIEDGVICNTSSTIDHECVVRAFAHVCPGSVLCGNVTIGTSTFIGANSVVRQGITIGENVTIGAGSVVIADLEKNQRYFGNPAILK